MLQHNARRLNAAEKKAVESLLRPESIPRREAPHPAVLWRCRSAARILPIIRYGRRDRTPLRPDKKRADERNRQLRLHAEEAWLLLQSDARLPGPRQSLLTSLKKARDTETLDNTFPNTGVKIKGRFAECVSPFEF
jgi:hypothetical protein